MTNRQLRESGVEPGWKARIVDKWCEGCRQNSEGLMDKWLGKTMTVRAIGDGFLRMEEDLGTSGWVNGWLWYAPSIAEVFNQIDDTETEIATDDELTGLLFG